jgi:hypothetical protein
MRLTDVRLSRREANQAGGAHADCGHRGARRVNRALARPCGGISVYRFFSRVREPGEIARR